MSALEALRIGPVPIDQLLAAEAALNAKGAGITREERLELRMLTGAIRDAWGTPDDLFSKLHTTHQFTVDCAAEPWNAKLPRWFGIGGERPDGLRASWAGETWFCNPPFSQIERWLQYAWSWYDPDKPRARVGVMLMPATRSEQDWWQNLVEPFRDTPQVWAELRCELRCEFLSGRTHYVPPVGVAESSPRFGSCLLTWRPL